jgi:hypothetical protein
LGLSESGATITLILFSCQDSGDIFQDFGEIFQDFGDVFQDFADIPVARRDFYLRYPHAEDAAPLATSLTPIVDSRFDEFELVMIATNLTAQIDLRVLG